ncbi:MAG: endonuclease/exonuclease/phosphatase family protein [Patescibacteria group bacterium]|jgi:endonuclease/exonuclease/phosphatase family metal-dependent hydrolase
MRVFNWNILFSGDYKKQITFIKKFDPDIITLQEVSQHFTNPGGNGNDVYAFFQENLPGYSSVYAPMTQHTSPLGTGWLGNAIFSKTPITSHTVHFLDNHPDGWGSDRNLLLATTNIAGKALTVATTHLWVQRPDEPDSKEKTEETKKFLAYLPTMSPCILTGDFNAAPQNNVVRECEKRFKNADPKHAPTFSCFPVYLRGLAINSLEYTFDYLFYTPEFVLVDFKILPGTTSDHTPIIAELNWR